MHGYCHLGNVSLMLGREPRNYRYPNPLLNEKLRSYSIYIYIYCIYIYIWISPRSFRLSAPCLRRQFGTCQTCHIGWHKTCFSNSLAALYTCTDAWRKGLWGHGSWKRIHASESFDFESFHASESLDFESFHASESLDFESFHASESLDFESFHASESLNFESFHASESLDFESFHA